MPHFFMGRRILTTNDFPPIPPRNWDWCACLDGDEECGPYGYGRTEREAINNLRDELGEEPPEREAGDLLRNP